VKDLAPAEKERVRKRMQLFCRNHQPGALAKFEKNVDALLAAATETERRLFRQLCTANGVDPAVEEAEAAAAGLLPRPDAAAAATTATAGAAGASPAIPTEWPTTALKDLSMADKDRVRRRVRLFFTTYQPSGMTKFVQCVPDEVVERGVWHV
jgi:hypothetical protein